jgi:hypothetical protein
MIFELSRLPAALRLALALLFGAGLVVLLLLGLRGDLADRHAGRERWDAGRTASLQAAAQMRTAAERVHAYVRDPTRADPLAGANDADPLLAEPAMAFRSAYETYGRALVANGQDGQNLAEVGVAWQQYLSAWDRLRQHSRRTASDPTELAPPARQPELAEMAQAYQSVTQAIDKLVAYRRQPADAVVQPSTKLRLSSRLLLAIGLLAGLCTLIAVGVAATLRAAAEPADLQAQPAEDGAAMRRVGPVAKA